MDTRASIESVLAAYGIKSARVNAVSVGLINRTFRVETEDDTFIVQRVNPIFSPRVHEDIDAVTRHVAARPDAGFVMPALVPTQSGALWLETEGEVWRMLTFIPGETHERLQDPAIAREAGLLLGRFHHAVLDLTHEFKNRRLGVHDTPKHLAALETALAAHVTHARYGTVKPLGDEILARARALPALPASEDRIVHGDPKISNVLFSSTGQARALVDLDTLARMPVLLELGDAFRSWCNPGGEDQLDVNFSIPLFRAAVEGYAQHGVLSAAERGAIVAATETIILELAARFCADALNESYFGWNSSKFSTRGEHNELRARAQLALVRDLATRREEACAVVEHAFQGR